MASYRLILLFFLTSTTWPILGQRQITGRILDAENKKPVKEAKIKVASDKETVTNALGFFQLLIYNSDSIIRVDANGYVGDNFRIPEINSFQINLLKIREIAVEESAEFPGGVREFYRYMANTINLPREVRDRQVSGKVLASFLVDIDGSVNPDSIKIIQSLHPSCDREVIRVLKKSPKWKPGSLRGEPTRQRIVIPVEFAIR